MINNENVVFIKKDDKEIYLIGTAHILKESKELVEEVYNEVNPDTVCVELCESRYKSLKEKDKWQNLDIIKVIKEGNGFLLFTTMILSSFQKKLGLDLGNTPGEEMLTAINLAENNNKNIVLADRDINTTLKRAWNLSSFTNKFRIINILLSSLFEDEDVELNDIKELMKGHDLLNELMDYFSNKLPEVKKVFIDERNIFIANKIINSPGKKIIAVVGKGHLKGIQELIEKGFNYSNELEIIPKEGFASNLFKWSILIVILLIFLLGFLKGKAVALSMLGLWVIVTGTTTAISALLVLAHPITIISSWIVAPITTLNPTIGAGMFLALIEAFFHKPRVIDLENLHNDILSVKGFFKNRVSKILLVFIATSIGASIGTFVAIPWITSLLK